MIVLFTDFGREGPYVAQMQAQIMRRAPDVPVLDLFADVPAYDIKAGAYLLPAYIDEFPTGTVFVCVVDPGVGGDRPPVVLWADERWFVGPGNGLLTLVARRAEAYRFYAIDWMPETLSSTFHGRDLFAPVAAGLARGSMRLGGELDDPAALGVICTDWPDELTQVIYVDGFGNAMTGVRASALTDSALVTAGGQTLTFARTFSQVVAGTAFWYGNANGLVELAVNGGNAAERLGLRPGDAISVSADAVGTKDQRG